MYDMELLEEVPPDLRGKYFLRGYGEFEGLARVRPELRKMIDFRRINFRSNVRHGIARGGAAAPARQVLSARIRRIRRPGAGAPGTAQDDRLPAHQLEPAQLGYPPAFRHRLLPQRHHLL